MRRTRARSCPRRDASSGCGCRAAYASMPASRRATRSAPRYDPMLAKLIAHGADAGRGDRPAARRARRDRGRGSDNQPAVPALARRAPGAPRRRDDDRLPRRASTTLRAARSAARGAWRAPFRLNLPSPPPAPPPDVARSARAGRRAPARRRQRADAGDGRARPRRPGSGVEARQPLVVLEAMKMETPLLSPYDAHRRRRSRRRGRPRGRRHGARRALGPLIDKGQPPNRRWSFITAPRSPLIFTLPVMYAVVGFCSPADEAVEDLAARADRGVGRIVRHPR